MQRLYQLQTHMSDDKSLIPFSSKAQSVDGVFRSFLKNPLAKYLKNGTMYTLYVSDFLGYKRVGCAYYNGKAFIKVAMSDFKRNNTKVYTLDKGELKECQEQ